MLISLHSFQSAKNSECSLRNFSTGNRHIASFYNLWLITIINSLGGYTVHLTWGKKWYHNSVDMTLLVCCPRYRAFTQARDWYVLYAPKHRTVSQQEVSGSYYLNIFRYFKPPSLTSSRSYFYFSGSYRLLTR